MNGHKLLATVMALFFAATLSGCGVSKESFFGPETSWDNTTSFQKLVVSDMAAPTSPTYDPGVAALVAKGYKALEVSQFGDEHSVGFFACGDYNDVDCQDKAVPTNESPYVISVLSAAPTDDTLLFSGRSYLLYPAGNEHNEHYSIRCDILRTAASATTSGITTTLVADMPELGGLVAEKVAPIKVSGDYPVTNLEVRGSIYGCVLDYQSYGALR